MRSNLPAYEACSCRSGLQGTTQVQDLDGYTNDIEEDSKRFFVEAQ